jgi:hypothetical protein
MQVIERGRRSDFDVDGAKVDVRDDWARGSVDQADAVVVIGDLGGTLQVFEAAIALGKPVIPVSGSGGDAAKAARALSLEARSRDALGPKVLQLVSKPVDSQGRAETTECLISYG